MSILEVLQINITKFTTLVAARKFPDILMPKLNIKVILITLCCVKNIQFYIKNWFSTPLFFTLETPNEILFETINWNTALCWILNLVESRTLKIGKCQVFDNRYDPTNNCSIILEWNTSR